MPVTALIVSIVVVVGGLIGALGIGGVLLVPALTYLGDIPVHAAIPACMLSYLVTGLIGSAVFARYGSLDLRQAVGLCAGALPGAFAGALLLPHIAATAIEGGIAVLILYSAVNALRPGPAAAGGPPVSGWAMVAIGFVTGVGSALTGTGGPVLLIPFLLALRTPLLTAIGLSQAVQIPVSLAATAGNVLNGQLDLPLAAILAVALGAGALLGAWLTQRLPAALLKRAVAVMLIVVGLLILADLAAGQLGR